MWFFMWDSTNIFTNDQDVSKKKKINRFMFIDGFKLS